MSSAIILMGVSGSGKTTVGRALAAARGCAFFEGDNYMPPANVEKMAASLPLTDVDRAPWLATLHDLLAEQAGAQVVLACSALKQSYRRQLSAGLQVRYVMLKGDFDLIAGRLQKRLGHYMPESLLQSQFDTLEEPEDAIVVNVDQPVDAIVKDILAALPVY